MKEHLPLSEQDKQNISDAIRLRTQLEVEEDFYRTWLKAAKQSEDEIKKIIKEMKEKGITP